MIFLWISWIFLSYFCFNQQWKSFLLSTWHITFHQYFRRLSILSPIPPVPLFTNLTFFRRLLLALNTNYFHLWLVSANVPMGRWSKSPECPLRQGLPWLIWEWFQETYSHKYTLQTMCQTCSSVVLSWWPFLVLGWEREPPAAVSTL